MILDRFGNPISNESVESKAREYLNSINPVTHDYGYLGADNINQFKQQSITAKDAIQKSRDFFNRINTYRETTGNPLTEDEILKRANGDLDILAMKQQEAHKNNADWADFDNITQGVDENYYTRNKMQFPQLPERIIPGVRNIYLAAGAAAVPAVLYGANALMSGGGETMQRTALNTGGNLTGGIPGAYAGYQLAGIPGAIAGGLAGAALGGYASDRVGDIFDPTMGMNEQALAAQAEDKKQAALSLLDQYLDPRSQDALRRKIVQQQIMQAQAQ